MMSDHINVHAYVIIFDLGFMEYWFFVINKDAICILLYFTTSALTFFNFHKSWFLETISKQIQKMNMEKFPFKFGISKS